MSRFSTRATAPNLRYPPTSYNDVATSPNLKYYKPLPTTHSSTKTNRPIFLTSTLHSMLTTSAYSRFRSPTNPLKLTVILRLKFNSVWNSHQSRIQDNYLIWLKERFQRIPANQWWSTSQVLGKSAISPILWNFWPRNGVAQKLLRLLRKMINIIICHQLEHCFKTLSMKPPLQLSKKLIIKTKAQIATITARQTS